MYTEEVIFKIDYITYNSDASEWQMVNYEVPQGSILGLTLFLLSVNNLVSAVSSSAISGVVTDFCVRVDAWFRDNKL